MIRWILSTAAPLAASDEAQAQLPLPQRWMYLDVPLHVEMPVVPTLFVGDTTGMPDVKQAPAKHARQMLLQDAIIRFPSAPR